jgi:hypothetical protein
MMVHVLIQPIAIWTAQALVRPTLTVLVHVEALQQLMNAVYVMGLALRVQYHIVKMI